MGTRADFYTRTGDRLEWLGSIAWDGHPSSLRSLRRARSLGTFLGAIDRMAKKREDWTPALAGWPWPWLDSTGTDYAYVFELDDEGDGGRVAAYEFGKRLRRGRPVGEDPGVLPPRWPRGASTTTARVPIGSTCSGILVVGLA